MSAQEATGRPISRSSWVVQAVLSLAYLVVSIIDAAEHYPLPAVVSVTAISFAVGLAIFRPRWAFTVAKGQAIAIAIGALALGGMLFWLTSTFAPKLTEGIPLAIGGLWFSTSLRGVRESQRVVAAIQ